MSYRSNVLNLLNSEFCNNFGMIVLLDYLLSVPSIVLYGQWALHVLSFPNWCRQVGSYVALP